MAKIHVGKTRLSNRRLDAALAQCSPGDELLLHEGTHRLEAFSLNGVHLTGVGDPDQVVVEGRIDVLAETRIRGVTLRAPHFGNAIYLRSPDARVDLTGCTVHGDPAKRYPTIYGEGGTAVLAQTIVHSAPGVLALTLEQPGYVHAVDSSIHSLRLTGGRAVLSDLRTTSITGRQGARIESYDTLTLREVEGYYALSLSDESVCTIPDLSLPSGPAEALCVDSFLQVETVRASEDAGLLALVRGHAVVESGDGTVRTRDADAPPEPKVVQWPVAEAASFDTAIAPQINVGDTVQLEEGEYELPDDLRIAVHLVGAADPSRTVVRGNVAVMDGQDASLSRLTVAAPDDHNGVSNRGGGSLTLTDVIVTSTSETYPAIYLESGTTTLERCTVVALSDARVGITYVAGEARLTATGSSVGWLQVAEGGRAEMRDCASRQLWAGPGTTITSRGGHVVEHGASDQRHVIAEVGATLTAEELSTGSAYVEGYAADARLTIERLEGPSDGTIRIQTTGDPQVQAEGPTVVVEDLDQVALGRPSSDGAADEGDHGSRAAPPSEDPIGDIEALTGLTKVKDQIRKFTRMVRYNQLRAEQGKVGTPMVMHSLFLGNPGTGKTTVARLLGQALHQSGAIATDTFVEVTGRADLVGDTIGSSAKITTAVLESARGGVLFIDEAYSLHKPNNNEFAQEAVDTILTFMENHRDDIVVIFAGYGEQMQDFLGMNPGLRSRVTNRFDFEDYTPHEIAEIGYRALVDSDHTVDEELYRTVVAREYQRATDRSNGRWVRNFNQELVSVLAERVLASPDGTDISHIADADLHTLVGGSSQDKTERVHELLAELDAMEGLTPVKEWVRRLVNQVSVDRRRMQRDGTTSRPTYHTVFAGSPGTGKTTVARIVAELFHNLGILGTPTVKEVAPDQMVGQYIGQTEARTTKIVDEALGGVLFVDEAYDLLGSSHNDFGQKVIGTLLPRLENDRDKFVAIFAGYSDDMRRFLAANSGLASRVPGWIEFPDYSDEEVARIVVARLRRTWFFDEDHLERVARAAYAAAERRDNGRWARNFAERLEAEQNEYLATHDVPDAQLDHVPAHVIDALAPRTG